MMVVLGILGIFLIEQVSMKRSWSMLLRQSSKVNPKTQAQKIKTQTQR